MIVIKTIEGRHNPDWPVMSNYDYWTKAEAIARSLDMPDLVRFAQIKKRAGLRYLMDWEYCCDACIIEGPAKMELVNDTMTNRIGD